MSTRSPNLEVNGRPILLALSVPEFLAVVTDHTKKSSSGNLPKEAQVYYMYALNSKTTSSQLL